MQLILGNQSSLCGRSGEIINLKGFIEDWFNVNFGWYKGLRCRFWCELWLDSHAWTWHCGILGSLSAPQLSGCCRSPVSAVTDLPAPCGCLGWPKASLHGKAAASHSVSVISCYKYCSYSPVLIPALHFWIPRLNYSASWCSCLLEFSCFPASFRDSYWVWS